LLACLPAYLLLSTYDACLHLNVYFGLLCSFVKELQALRRKLEAAPDDAAEFSLVCLIQAIKYCVSFLKEGRHDAVLTTVLSIGLWDCTLVRSQGKVPEVANEPAT
jgi:hypothetical protein